MYSILKTPSNIFIDDIPNQTTQTVTTVNPITEIITQSNEVYDNFFPTFNEFSKSLYLNQYSIPSKEKYEIFKSEALAHGEIKSKLELAMFLAHVFFQSNGLTNKVETQCGSGCRNCHAMYTYPADFPGKYYCGRGFLQLVNILLANYLIIFKYYFFP